jgi:uncharacterized membrane protein YfcA
MPLINAIGSSLVCVTAFGLTTAMSYAASELVDWRLAVLVIVGGTVGSPFGIQLSRRLAEYKRALPFVFSTAVFAAGVYVIGAATQSQY